MAKAQTPHIVILPSPMMGHLIPLAEFSKRLVHRQNFSVTSVIPTNGSSEALQKSTVDSIPNRDSVFLPPVDLSDLPGDAKAETVISLMILRSLSSFWDVLKSLVSKTKLVALVVGLFGTTHSMSSKPFRSLLHLPSVPMRALSDFFRALPSITSSVIRAASGDGEPSLWGLNDRRRRPVSRTETVFVLKRQRGLELYCFPPGRDRELVLKLWRARRLLSRPLRLPRRGKMEVKKKSMGFGDHILTSKSSVMVEKDGKIDDESLENDDKETEIKRANWVNRLMEIHSRWKSRQLEDGVDGIRIFDENENRDDGDGEEDNGACEVNYDSNEDEEEDEYNRESFSKLLAKVSFSDTKLFSCLAFLCNIVYVIPEIMFVASSLEKKAEVATIKAKIDQDSAYIPVSVPETTESKSEKVEGTRMKRRISLSVVYEIAALAASYVRSRAKGLLSPGFKSQVKDDEGSCRSGDQPGMEGEDSPRVYNSEVAAYMATSAMTAVDSLASWQANLLFEPMTFEDTGVLVHRGIYEAAKGLYEQFLPEIMDHLERHGDRAKLQFTGHSLGGSLSLLVSLMLLTKKVVKPSALRPVVTFGAPFVFCGGQKIFDELGLDDNHVHCVMMHRDIVPRSFSCKYPNHAAVVLKRLPGSLRTHPKLLYTPLGKLFILQPSEKSSPPHPLIPPGNALYTLDKTHTEYSVKALKAFLNCPHPLDTLSDLTPMALTNHAKISEVRVVWPLLASRSPHSWSRDRTLETNLFSNKEIMTGV
ncbi:hypothetical protein F3Y22_tig00110549pilonHSYRG00065 [Hibiscus syriacus]|uniref:Fungal lipase-type domain-containing protein n=1 Tax=Hibiscus syriacus TaxID=106335 RepID=A0A6A3A968_HIBSY|nr:hypothetical protein F3Y22_tig00110549pilonHSYRG00065 [Hibiscus syriacus]